jgi:murein L,D-transpeptidase YafK
MKFANKIIIFLLTVALLYGTAYSGQKADSVLVVKNESRLYLLREGKELAVFDVAFGSNPEGHKQQQGDERTPEGHYILDYKNPNSKFYKSIHISYPNARDRDNARKRGVDPGGNIMIHGQLNGYGGFSTFVQLFNWTDGCIALSNNDMDFVWEAVNPGTPIEIRP